MTEFISSMPLLVLFFATWIISFPLALIVPKKYKLPVFFVVIVSSLMIINFSTVAVHCVSCAGAEITISNLGVFALPEVFISQIGFVLLEIILIIYYALTGGYEDLKEDGKQKGLINRG